jgi:hypothetical protein
MKYKNPTIRRVNIAIKVFMKKRITYFSKKARKNARS